MLKIIWQIADFIQLLGHSRCPSGSKNIKSSRECIDTFNPVCHPSRPIRGQYPGHVITLDQSEVFNPVCHLSRNKWNKILPRRPMKWWIWNIIDKSKAGQKSLVTTNKTPTNRNVDSNKKMINAKLPQLACFQVSANFHTRLVLIKPPSLTVFSYFRLHHSHLLAILDSVTWSFWQFKTYRKCLKHGWFWIAGVTKDDNTVITASSLQLTSDHFEALSVMMPGVTLITHWTGCDRVPGLCSTDITTLHSGCAGLSRPGRSSHSHPRHTGRRVGPGCRLSQI